MSALDTQIGGDHYRAGSIQPIQYIEANSLQFLEANVVKRVTRHNRPTGKGRQDIEKAIHELQLLLELRYAEPVEGLPVTMGAPWLPHAEGSGNPAGADQVVEVTFANGERDIGFAGNYSWIGGSRLRITHWRPHVTV